MTSAQVVETSVTVNNNSPIQDYVHPDDQTQPTYEMTPGFKPFMVVNLLIQWNFTRNRMEKEMKRAVLCSFSVCLPSRPPGLPHHDTF